jgi:hypothetical protein
MGVGTEGMKTVQRLPLCCSTMKAGTSASSISTEQRRFEKGKKTLHRAYLL